jgi:hypothetical protein
MFIAIARGIARISALAWSEKTIRFNRGPWSRALRHREAQIGGHFFERAPLVALEPLFGSGNGARFLFALRLVVDRGVADRGGFGVGQHFEQTDHGFVLAKAELVKHLMGVLSVHVSSLVFLLRAGIRQHLCLVAQNQPIEQCARRLLILRIKLRHGLELKTKIVVRAAFVLSEK